MTFVNESFSLGEKRRGFSSPVWIRTLFNYSSIKRCLDVFAALVSAPVSLLIIGILAIVIKLDGGSVLYSQKRVGKNGRSFTLWKLRTMVPNAERTLQDFLAANASAQREWNETQKLRRDPRVTCWGAYMRKYSLDEVPQLWNVLIGDMSLVGPRPILPEQAPLYPGVAYFEMRPGLTGLWQISARNDSPFAGRAAYDTRYAEIMSLGTDLSILLRTARVIVRGTGF